MNPLKNLFAYLKMRPIYNLLSNINPLLKAAMKHYQFYLFRDIERDMNQIEPFLEKMKKLKKISDRDYSYFDRARLISDNNKITEISNKYELQDAIAKVLFMLTDLDKRAQIFNIPVNPGNFRKGDYPIRVRNYEELMKYADKELGTDSQSIKTESELIKAHLQRPMTDIETAKFVTDIFKKRTARNISYITPEMQQFYDSSDSALIHYINSMNIKIVIYKMADDLAEKEEIPHWQCKKIKKTIENYFHKQYNIHNHID